MRADLRAEAAVSFLRDLVLVLLMIWLIPKVWRFIRSLIRKVTGTSARPGNPSGRGADV